MHIAGNPKEYRQRGISMALADASVFPTEPKPEAEVGSLARELARAYTSMLTFYQREYKLSPSDADAKARGVDEPSPDGDRGRALERPADEVSWWALQRLAEHDPGTMEIAWNRIKAEARKELESGHRTASALEWQGSSWDRARFLAIRNAFRESWAPLTGTEAALVDMLAHSFEMYLKWSERLVLRAETEGQLEDDKLKRDGYWQPPRIGLNEAIEQAAAMAERWHRLFLRTLRSLQDVRRLPGVHVASAGQINIGGQQVNFAGPADGRADDGR
jgi:hypothetical protein